VDLEKADSTAADPALAVLQAENPFALPEQDVPRATGLNNLAQAGRKAEGPQVTDRSAPKGIVHLLASRLLVVPSLSDRGQMIAPVARPEIVASGPDPTTDLTGERLAAGPLIVQIRTGPVLAAQALAVPVSVAQARTPLALARGHRAPIPVPAGTRTGPASSVHENLDLAISSQAGRNSAREQVNLQRGKAARERPVPMARLASRSGGAIPSRERTRAVPSQRTRKTNS
jgi:hypothetical protein